MGAAGGAAKITCPPSKKNTAPITMAANTINRRAERKKRTAMLIVLSKLLRGTTATRFIDIVHAATGL